MLTIISKWLIINIRRVNMSKIITTIGIYSNGQFKFNGVLERNLQSHIEYNKQLRFGRALIVDGQIAYSGIIKEEALHEIILKNKLNEMK